MEHEDTLASIFVKIQKHSILLSLDRNFLVPYETIDNQCMYGFNSNIRTHRDNQATLQISRGYTIFYF